MSPSTALAAAGRRSRRAPVEVAELSAPFSPQEVILRNALGLGDDVNVNPSGGALAANPVMVTGLVRVIEAARQVSEQGRDRVLAHATAGQALQQNLVCILEGSTVSIEPTHSLPASSASARPSTRRRAPTSPSPASCARPPAARSTTPASTGATSTRW